MAASNRSRLGAAAGMIAVLAALTWLFHANMVLFPLSVDANAYHLGGRLLAEHGRLHRTPAEPLQFLGMQWVCTPGARCYPKYPPFYPAALAGVTVLLGQEAALLLNPVCALLTVIGLFVLARRWLPRPHAVLVAALVAVNPVFVHCALRQMAHPLSVCLVVWGYAALVHASARSARLALPLRLGAGLLLGAACGVRYTNALLALPPLVLLLCEPHAGRGARRLLPAVPFVAGLALLCSVVGAYHWSAFGGPLTTGYALSAEQSAFSWTFLRANADDYLVGLVDTGIGPALALSCLALVLVGRRDRRELAFFVVWIVPTTLLHVAYWFAPDQSPFLHSVRVGYLRFLLPVVPGLVLLAVMGLRDVALAQPVGSRSRAAVVVVLVLLQGLWSVSRTADYVGRRRTRRTLELEAVRAIEQRVPAGATIFADFKIAHCLEVLQRYMLFDEVLLDRDRLALLGGLQRRPEAMSGVQPARLALFKRRLVDVDPPTYRRRILALWRRARRRGRGVYLVVARPTLDLLRLRYGAAVKLEHLTDVGGGGSALTITRVRARGPHGRPGCGGRSCRPGSRTSAVE